MKRSWWTDALPCFRSFELIEPEGERWGQYAWPYGGLYSIYRESVSPGQVESLSLSYNNLPPGKRASCYLSPIKALPLAACRVMEPTLSIGSKTVDIPVQIESGQYLELSEADDCKLYGPQGQLVRAVTPQGEVPLLEQGKNEVRFRCGDEPGPSPRPQVTVISLGEPLP